MPNEPVRGGLPEASFFSLSGMEQVRRAMRGLVVPPPVHHLFGHRVTQVGVGTVTGTQPASVWFQTLDGTVDFRILMESAAYYAVVTGVPAATTVHTSALAITNMRPCTIDSGALLARARTLNSGPTFTFTEVLVEDSEGRTVAHGTASYVVRPIDPPPSPVPDDAEPFTAPVYGTPDPWQRPLSWSPGDLGFDRRSLLDIFQAVDRAEVALPPLEQLLGMRVFDAGEGTITLALTASEWFGHRHRQVAPGVISSLAWHASGGAMATLAPIGTRLSVVDQTVTFVRPVPSDGRDLLARGSVTHRCDDLLLSTAEITDGNGNTVAVGHQTSLLTARRSRSAAAAPERVLATVLFTDIVCSTEEAERLGDARWTELLDEHHRVVRKQLEIYKGREVKTTGDGFLATFDTPGRAVQAARAIREGVPRLGLHVRVGLHTGECEVSGTDVAGIAIHIAARIQGLAAPNEILVSGTVRDLVTGSGLHFEPRGDQHLKGIEGSWSIFAVVG